VTFKVVGTGFNYLSLLIPIEPMLNRHSPSSTSLLEFLRKVRFAF
jgi:hypothetical protein